MIIPVILSGGSGTRLWPLSRRESPKQFLKFFSKKSLFQETILRIPKYCSKPIIITNEDQRFLVKEQLKEINIEPEAIVLEPMGKNTAPAITIAALKSIEYTSNPSLIVFSADHYIKNKKTFSNTISKAITSANKGNIVTLGVKPNKPETGYGYIKGKKTSDSEYVVEEFIEKPSLKSAIKLSKSEDIFWNSGIFIFESLTILSEIKKFEPDLYKSCVTSYKNKRKDLNFIKLSKDLFDKCPSISIDYAVMERTNLAKMIPLNTLWSDLGSWDSLLNIKTKDRHQNFLDGDIIENEVFNSYICSKDKLTVVQGLKDVVVVNTEDALFISRRDLSHNIKDIVSELDHRDEVRNHTHVNRPWGFFKVLEKRDNYQVKKINIKPHAKISLQKHMHRSEHWVVVKGTATVTKGKDVLEIQENESIYIPVEEIHRLENKTNKELEIIEVQTGKYLGEDDIIRYEDLYHRN